MTTKQVILFGGSFNPPHRGHGQVLEYLEDLPQFDEVWMLPTYDHPLEKGLAPFEDRIKMCEQTLAGLGENVFLCLIEGELKNKPSYFINTIKALNQEYPDHKFTVAVGSDCRDNLNGWKDADALKEEVSFLFIPRPGFEDSPFMDVSSSTIRQLIKEKKNYTEYVLPQVAEYIKKNKLYET